MKLALGSVQFGLPYGISNHQGKTNLKEVEKILNLAKQHQIETIDTAAAYGDSEEVLGTLSVTEHFKLVTKIPALDKVKKGMSSLIEQRFIKLNTARLYGLMFHQASDLLTSHGKKLYRQALEYKKQKKISKLGVSIYQTSELTTLTAQLPIDMIQVPFNCLDQRFIAPEIIQLIDDNNIEVHARSIFLQGLLLMPIYELADYFKPYQGALRRFDDMCKHLNCHPLTLALKVAQLSSHISKAVVGCCSAQQLTQILEHEQLAKQLSIPMGELNQPSLQTLACHEQGLINPSLWPKRDVTY